MNQHELGLQLSEWGLELGVVINEKQAQQLILYITELIRWNKKFNLTAIEDPRDAILKHIVDSLSIVPHIPDGSRVIDVGTGAGLPGLVVALMCPHVSITLLDSQQKKIHFVQHAATTLQLKNINVVHARVELYQDSVGFDIITSRAFASIDTFCKTTQHLVAKEGLWLAMKGAFTEQEESLLPGERKVVNIQRLQLPGSGDQRSLVFIG